LTQPDEICFDPKGKIEKFGILRGNFPNPEVADPNRTRETKK